MNRGPRETGAHRGGESAAGGGGARQGVAGGRMCARLQDARYFGTRSAGRPGYFETGYFWMFGGGGADDEDREKIRVELSKIWPSDGRQLVVSSRAFTRVV